jgi:hypothetical protein
MSEHDDHSGWSLLMPFVNVTSVGGKFDDEAFVAGYEIGKLDSTLQSLWLLHVSQHVELLRAENIGQAELVAMRYGYHLSSIEDGGWAHATFSRVEAPGEMP